MLRLIHFSSALLANGLYLNEFAKSSPERISQKGPGSPEFVGNVYIHPTAHIHPSVKVPFVYSFD
ncbi:hypothetical protein DSO57_1031660 [Entomophthora muscae]|uniref:Uncharacterized protein n=1 Tax=Entomophthora muscae TaxID=34485 RepID=A0ACC2TMV0_9FUNG|nr:hypothetical protein DSO57_1031660 [Entomophthora muscae]